nr:putative reverse transcriptase domain-containing protein [Tanacetum cinerariifolium]
MEVDIEEDENEPELTYPYEEVDPLNPLPSASESELEDVTEVENPIENEDETVPASVHEVGESSTIVIPQKNGNVDAAIAAERARQVNVRNDASGSRPVRGQDTAPAIQEKKVKFAVVTLQGPALTWWNAKVATMGLKTVNQMPWTEMEQLMTIKFCPIEEVQRMEHKL